MEEKPDPCARNGEKAAQGATGDAEPVNEISLDPGNAQPTRWEEREGSAGKTCEAEGGRAQGVAGEGQPIAVCGGAVGPEQSGIGKAPNTDELEPGRETGRAPEAIRKPRAARDV